MDSKPLVSVCLLTYNHSKYIGQAIESVLFQKVGFPWELIIADDCSTDGAKEIIAAFVAANPGKINFICREKNVGAHKNWHEMVGAAAGKYIAYIEGDDYWNDPFKLATQIKFLEDHPEFVGCCHNAEERFETGGKASFLYCRFEEERSISFQDMAVGNLIPSCSMVYRNRLFDDVPAWYRTLKMGDWPLHLLNMQYGNYWYIPRVMGVHRLHTESVWMMQDADRNNKFIEDAYDIMIRGFGSDTPYGEVLKKGRESFLATIKPIKPEPRFKRRVKNLMKRVIDKI